MLGTYTTSLKRLSSFSIAILMVASITLISLLNSSVANAAQMTKRRVEMSTSVVSTAVTADFIFQFPTAVDVTGIEIEFSDSPLGVYSALPANDPAIGTPTATLLTGASTGTLSGTAGTAVNGDTFRTWTNTGAFTVTGGAAQDGDGFTGTPGTGLNQIQLTRATGASETLDSSAGTTAHALRIGGLTNDNSPNTTFFARIRVYTGGTTTTLVHDGVVAGSTAQVLTVQARVQEVLEFCIGALAPATVTAWTGNASTTSCTAVTGTVVDLGPVGSSAINVSSSSPDGNGFDGVAMLRSNAVNGTSIVYKAILAAGGTLNRGALKISGAACDTGGAADTDLDAAFTNTDRCFNSDEGGRNFGTNTEGFGFRLVNVDTASETPTANLTSQGSYASGTDYSWDDDGQSVLIASSTGATEKVVDDEAFQLKFGARSALTTPTGQYSVQAEFIAATIY